MALPIGLGPGAMVWMAIAILAAAFIRGYSGFGYSAIVIAAAGVVTNPLNFVAAVVILESAMSIQAMRGIGPHIDWRRVWLMLAGAAVGLPLGLWALTGVSETAARGLISGYILLMSGVLLAGCRHGREVRGGGNLFVGLVSGVANAPGMGGLPIAAFFAAQPMAAATFRATLIAYFPLLDLYSAPLYWWHGLIGWHTLRIALAALPLTFLGNWLGSRHFLKTDPGDFRRFAILLLATLAALGLVRAVAG